ncbi:unnamed protein product [Pleuronectes platessa]|uniref:Uncharacterized protein n=1 Tax=Pleuronectes platessa TaxID=8262 RepID=A0A9N7Z7Z6_PLEPL|nr:unnamed protein product [Pleuronectes platessa]
MGEKESVKEGSVAGRGEPRRGRSRVGEGPAAMDPSLRGPGLIRPRNNCGFGRKSDITVATSPRGHVPYPPLLITACGNLPTMFYSKICRCTIWWQELLVIFEEFTQQSVGSAFTVAEQTGRHSRPGGSTWHAISSAPGTLTAQPAQPQHTSTGDQNNAKQTHTKPREG